MVREFSNLAEALLAVSGRTIGPSCWNDATRLVLSDSPCLACVSSPGYPWTSPASQYQVPLPLQVSRNQARTSAWGKWHSGRQRSRRTQSRLWTEPMNPSLHHATDNKGLDHHVPCHPSLPHPPLSQPPWPFRILSISAPPPPCRQWKLAAKFNGVSCASRMSWEQGHRQAPPCSVMRDPFQVGNRDMKCLVLQGSPNGSASSPT